MAASGSRRSQGLFLSRGGRERRCSVQDNGRAAQFQPHFGRNSISVEDRSEKIPRRDTEKNEIVDRIQSKPR